MALFSSCTSGDEFYVSSSTARSSVCRDMVDSIPSTHTFRFTTAKQMGIIIENAREELSVDESRGQYLVFHNMNEKAVRAFDRAGWRGGVRLTYHEEYRVGIVKLMPSGLHDISAQQLFRYIRQNLTGMGVGEDRFTPMGSARLLAVSTSGFRSRSSKEGDMLFKPATRRNENAFPTFVIEVGVSESLSQLHLDKDWWLMETGNATKLVIIMAIKRDVKRIHLETWQLRGPSSYSFRSNHPRPQQTGSLDITGSAGERVVTGDQELIIPWSCAFEVPNNPPIVNIILSTRDLEMFADSVWSFCE